MYCWHLLNLTWLVATRGHIFDQTDHRRHSAGWEAPPQANQRISWSLDPEPRPCIRASTALSNSGEYDLTSPSFALPWHLRRRASPNLTLAALHGSWQPPPLRALQTTDRVLPRRDSSLIYTRWTEDAVLRWQSLHCTKAPVSQDLASLAFGHQLPSQAGTLQPARCWRFTSARSCAQFKLPVLGGQPWRGPSFKCAPRRPTRNLSLCPLSRPQVLPPSTAAAAGSAHHSCSGAVMHCGLPYEVFAQGPPPRHRLRCIKPATTRNRMLLPGLFVLSGLHPGTQCSSQDPGARVFLQSRGYPTQHGAQSLRVSSCFEGCQAIHADTHLLWVRGVMVPSLEIDMHDTCLRHSFALSCRGCYADPAMGKRGRRTQRRRRPLDTTRESQRAPKRIRDATVVVSASSDDAEDVVDLDSDTEADDDLVHVPGSSSRSTPATPRTPRPLTVFSGVHPGAASSPNTGTPTRAVGVNRAPAHGLGSSVNDDGLFDQRVLRQELPPDEFMSIATLLNRPYANAAHGDAPLSVKPKTTVAIPGTVGPRDTGHRSWPAGAKPPADDRLHSGAPPMPRAPLAKPRPKAGPVSRLPSNSGGSQAEHHAPEGRLPVASTASSQTEDAELQRALNDADRPWLHCSITGDPIGPAPIHRDRVTGRLIVEWSDDQTIAYEGRAVLPQTGIKLFGGSAVYKRLQSHLSICTGDASHGPTRDGFEGQGSGRSRASHQGR